MKYIFSGILICIVILAVIVSFPKKHEHFSTNSTRIQKCLLNTNNDSSSDFISTYRLKEYPQDIISTGSEKKCYIYSSSNINLPSDINMTASDCTYYNFRNNPLISNVYLDPSPITTHEAPFDKCVFEFNQDNASLSNILSFNESLSNSSVCSVLYTSKLQEVNDARFSNSILSTNIATLKNANSISYNTVNALDALRTACSNNIQQSLSDYTTSNEMLTTLQRNITSVKNNLELQITETSNNINAVNSTLQQKWQNLSASRDNYDLNVYPNYVRQYNSNQNLILQRNNCLSNLDNIKRNLLETQTQYEIKKDLFQKSNDDTIICQNSVVSLSNELSTIRNEINKKDELITNLNRNINSNNITLNARRIELLGHKTFYSTHLSKYLNCTSNVSILNAEVDSLKRQKDMLITDIEDIKKRCRNDQSSFNMATINMQKDIAQEIIASEQQKCAASIAMRKRKTELQNEINGILSQGKECSRIVAACKCYKKVATFGWNDRVRNGNRLTEFKTSTGRIDEVRKVLAAAPYIKFNGVGEFATVTKTRRKASMSGEHESTLNVTGLTSPISFQITSVSMYSKV